MTIGALPPHQFFELSGRYREERRTPAGQELSVNDGPASPKRPRDWPSPKAREFLSAR